MIAKIRVTSSIGADAVVPVGSEHIGLLYNNCTACCICAGDNAWYCGSGQFAIVESVDFDKLKDIELESTDVHTAIGGNPKKITIEFFERH